MISISKDDFVKAIEDVRSAERCSTNLNYFFKENKVDGYLFFPDCSTTVVRLLHKFFGKADQDDWISYFCFELDFGKNGRKDVSVMPMGKISICIMRKFCMIFS